MKECQVAVCGRIFFEHNVMEIEYILSILVQYVLHGCHNIRYGLQHRHNQCVVCSAIFVVILLSLLLYFRNLFLIINQTKCKAKHCERQPKWFHIKMCHFVSNRNQLGFLYQNAIYLNWSYIPCKMQFRRFEFPIICDLFGTMEAI